ncbi:phosphonate metabolism transcriptional regulator PhnF [Devosia yakushimensis]|uniref:Phosphonate metabolism transcriptional regulator PhnF n=1 Tax=Devosia yakushimensis TaxID=470028 RepID=A0ABQ5UFU1_9HYPH|nr:phosphonate metabolism transcriptional regulator PhnF [Devosia yakushimensis]GLQ10513.1 phosphonate metabolism transcriptional regulator PhnF [Devosia yakushimensis]
MRNQGKSWEEVRDRISQEITSELLAADTRLPSEPEMCVLYNTRRHSLRRALAALVAEGKLRVEQGRGTFVERAPLLNYVIGSRTRFRENLMAQGLTASGQALTEMKIPASARVAAALQVPVSAPVYAISRRGFANDLPISVGWSYHDAERFPEMLERRRAGISVTEVYRFYGIADYRRLRTTVFTRIATESEAGLLMLRPGHSVMIVQKIDVDLEGRHIGFSEAVWAGDRVQFTFENDQPVPVPVERTDDV